MKNARYQAWQFLHPDLDAPGSAAGLRLAVSGGVAMVAERDAVRQAVLLLLSTVPGERVMRPAYGCHLHRLVFSPNDDTTAGLAIHYVRRAIEQWEPRVEIITVDAGQHPSHPARLDVRLEYRLRATPHTDRVSFSINLTGEAD